MPSIRKYAAFSVILLFFTSVFALPQTIPSIPGLPGTLTWQNSPHSWQLDYKNVLTISAEAKTDWFVDPFDDTVAKNAPILLFTPDPDYVLSTRVALKFVNKWDAGALMLWGDDHHWVRTFSLDTDLPIRVGFEAQSPAGSGAVVKFSAITYDSHRIGNIYK